jgi:hypothetical protein
MSNYKINEKCLSKNDKYKRCFRFAFEYALRNSRLCVSSSKCAETEWELLRDNTHLSPNSV